MRYYGRTKGAPRGVSEEETNGLSSTFRVFDQNERLGGEIEPRKAIRQMQVSVYRYFCLARGRRRDSRGGGGKRGQRGEGRQRREQATRPEDPIEVDRGES
jgi:hypothetical protein